MSGVYVYGEVGMGEEKREERDGCWVDGIEWSGDLTE